MLVTVAPLIVCTLADWAVRTSARSTGAARLLICTDFRSASVSCRAVTSVIVPEDTVICTWTAPKRVWTTAPSYVPADFAAAPEPAALPDDPEESADPVLPEDSAAEVPGEVPEVLPAPVAEPADVFVAELPVSAR